MPRKAGKHRRLSRAGPGLSLLFAVGCQGGYPIPASQCDEWCNAAQIPCVDLVSGDRDPAQCVQDCVRRGGDASECQLQHGVVLACLRDPASTGADCSTKHGQGLPRVCDDEQRAYEACAVRYSSLGPDGSGWY